MNNAEKGKMNNINSELTSLKENLSSGLYGAEDAPARRQSLGRSARRTTLVAAAGVLALGGGGAVAATVLSHQQHHLTAAQIHRTVAVVAPRAIPRDVTSDFSVLSNAVATLPADFVSTVSNSGVVRVAGANLNDAHAVTGLRTGTAYVVPGNGTMCLFVTNLPGGPVAGGGCVSDSGAQTEDLTETVGTAIAGVVPNGVSQVILTGANGTTRTIPVTDNVYDTNVIPGDPETLTDFRQDGRYHAIRYARH